MRLPATHLSLSTPGPRIRTMVARRDLLKLSQKYISGKWHLDSVVQSTDVKFRKGTRNVNMCMSRDS